MSVYGYARISRPSQSIDRQIRNIRREYPDAAIIQESYSGRSMNRPEWNKLYDKVQSGDTIVFDSVSRMSRTAEDGVAEYLALFDRGVNLIFLKERNIDTDVYKASLKDQVEMTGGDEDILLEAINRYLRSLAARQIRLAFEQSEKEVEDLRQRTREGMQTAKINGKQIGQKPGATLNIKKREKAIDVIRKHDKSFGGSLSDKECMQLCGISRNTFYKYKKEISIAENKSL